MAALIKPFLDICLLNANPQDLPASQALLVIALLAYGFLGLILALPMYGLRSSLLQVGVELLMLMGYTKLVLQWRAHGERYTQTLSALAGSGAILEVVAIPLAYSIYESSSGGRPTDAFTLLVYLLLVGWLLLVYGHVFRHALESRLWVGVVVGFVYIALSSVLIESLFPPPDVSSASVGSG